MYTERMLKQNLPQLIKKKKEKALKTTNSVFGRLKNNNLILSLLPKAKIRFAYTRAP